jgi:hypothetical protein
MGYPSGCTSADDSKGWAEDDLIQVREKECKDPDSKTDVPPDSRFASIDSTAEQTSFIAVHQRIFLTCIKSGQERASNP